MVREAILRGVKPEERATCRDFVREALDRGSDETLKGLLTNCAPLLYVEKPAGARFLLELMLRELSDDGA